jgi:hypothetical protein
LNTIAQIGKICGFVNAAGVFSIALILAYAAQAP